MTWARRTARGTTIFEWHKLVNGRCVCAGKPLKGQTETTEETPLISLTCSRCRWQGITLNTGNARPVVGIPEAVYRKVWQ